MTIIRTPRRWPGYRTHRRMKFAGTHVIRIPEVQDRDFTDIIRGAKIAVEARNNHGWGESRRQVVLHGRDRVDVEVVLAEEGKAVVCGSLGFRRPSTLALTVVVQA